MSEQIILLLILLVFSGFFSSSEIALFSISRTKARYIARQQRKPDILINHMKQDPDRLLSTILIGNNVVNVGAAAVATSLALSILPDHAVEITTGIMTLLIVLFGEFLPKSFATRNNIMVARIAIYPIYWLSIIFYPVIMLLNSIVKMVGIIKKPPAVTEAELRTFVDVVEEGGEIKEEEKELIYNIFELDDTNASEIMTPRTDMFTIKMDEPLDLEAIIKSGFTRIPVIAQDLDHVVGIVNIKDIFFHNATSTEDVDIRKIMREPYFVPENKKLDTLLQYFKKGKQHMAIVVDEHGGVSGLITLEDALEELVGDIIDETDKDLPHIVQLKDNEWAVLGKADIDEINETLEMNIPYSKEYDTFSGYILNKIDRIPEEKEEISVDDLVVYVDNMEGNRINKLIVRKNPVDLVS